MQFLKPVAATAIAAGLAVAGSIAVPVVAQTVESEAAPVEFSEQQLVAFAEAALDVAAIRDEYSLALAEVESEAEQEELVQEGNAAMLAAVEDNPGISVEEYLQIGEAAAADPELGEQISMLIQGMVAE